MARSGSSHLPQRRVTKNAVRLELNVFAEGHRTEKQYLVFWWRNNRQRVNVRLDPEPGVPLDLVKRAVKAKEKSDREAKRRQGRAYDQTWRVFDRDDHPHFAEACDLARSNGIQLALSNPCIELWLVLHFEDQTAHVDRHTIQRRATALTKCEKVLSGTALNNLADAHDEATRRVKDLDKKHQGDGSPPFSNPSSGVWRLVHQIRQGQPGRNV